MLIHHSFSRLAKVTCAIALLSAPGLLLADSFTQINLVSDIPGLAITTDPNLKNPWGVSFSPTSPFWVSNQGSGNATLYNGLGAITPLVVSIPGSATPPSGPTGQVFNTGGTGSFAVGGTAATFIFSNLNGTIAGWNGGAGTTAVKEATVAGAVFTGLAQGATGGATYLYAADSKGGGISVFDSTWANVTGTTFAGKFVDPHAVSGFVPFNIQQVGSALYVTYASLTATGSPL